MARRLVFAFVFTLVAAQSAFAQRQYINHRSYPAGFFDRISPGDASPITPGATIRHDGAGWYEELATSPTPEAPAPGGDPCVPKPNPYTEPARAVACYGPKVSAPRPPLPTYRVGRTYQSPYLAQMVVIAVTLGMDGVEVVTGQWVTADQSHGVGDVLAFRVTGEAGWREIQ